MMLIYAFIYLLRLASESVHSILPSPSQVQSVGVRGQAWGCVSLSDVLLLLEVKYDVVTHLLYAEMLQEHYSKETSPWCSAITQGAVSSLKVELRARPRGFTFTIPLLFFIGDATALSIWETLLPWQQHKEEEGLGDLADEALASGDMLRLAELPGALREYR